MQLETRLKIILIILVSVFGLLWIRLFYLQVMQGQTLRRVSESNRTATLYERAPRGLILDRHGIVLAQRKPTFVVLFSAMSLQKEELDLVVERLSKILNVPLETLQKKIKFAWGRKSIFRLAQHVPESAAFALAEQRPDLPGISVVTEMQRFYPGGDLAAHVLGYIGQVNAKEFAQMKDKHVGRDWLVGKTGLEKTYDSVLQGVPGGMRMEIDASGRAVKILEQRDSVPGQNLVTTLDANLQKVAQEALALTGKSGALVALDPRSGEVLVMASYPSYDPNSFLSMVQEQDVDVPDPIQFLRDKKLPLFHRALAGTYSPGSIFKIVTAAAFLKNGIDPQEKVFCSGSFEIPSKDKRKAACWKKDGHGWVNLVQAMAGSCNVYFYKNSLKVGPDAIEKMARNFGYGLETNLHFLNEKDGLISGREKTRSRRWYDGDTVNLSIGQGKLLVTPLQAAQMMGVMASGGKMPQLKLVREVGSQKIKSDPWQQFNLSKKDWDILAQALFEVVETGTGKNCKIPGLKVAAKTGTVQNPQGEDHAWAVCYAPADNPTIALSVIIEHGGKGGLSAIPVARKILEAACVLQNKHE